MNRADLDEATHDLSINIPNVPRAEALHSPEEIITERKLEHVLAM